MYNILMHILRKKKIKEVLLDFYQKNSFDLN